MENQGTARRTRSQHPRVLLSVKWKERAPSPESAYRERIDLSFLTSLSMLEVITPLKLLPVNTFEVAFRW